MRQGSESLVDIHALAIQTGYTETVASSAGMSTCFTCHGELHMLSRSMSHCVAL